MGNRAVITTKDKKIGAYIHWNGGRDSVEAFLKYCKLQGFPSPEIDGYGWGKFCQVLNNWGLDVDVNLYDKLDTDNYDNGVYVIQDWKIIDRLFFNGIEQHQYNLEDMLNSINDKQPEHMRLTFEQLMINNK